MSPHNTAPLDGYRPDIQADQVSFLREALGAISSYAATLYGAPSPQERLLLVARTADAVSDLAHAWDWGGYENAEVAQACLETLEEIEEDAPELVAPVAAQLREIIARLTGGQHEPSLEVESQAQD